MPRQSLTRRKDGRYKVKYHGHQFYGETQAEAIRKRDEYKQAEKDAIKLNCPTVATYAVEWLPLHKVGVSVRYYNDCAHYLDILIEFCGNMLLKDVKPSDIKKIYKVKFETYSESAIKKARGIFSALFDSAVDDQYIRKNPCRAESAKPHKGTEGTHRAITEEERALIHAVNHPFRPVVMIMLYAGLRRGEALALNISTDVNYTKKTISVSRALAYDTNQPTVKKPKSDAGIRIVPLFDVLYEEIKHIKGYAVTKNDGTLCSKTSFQEKWESYKAEVECYMNGYSQKRWYGRTKRDKEILSAGGQLPPWKEFTVRTHDLRHSYCTMLRDAGVDMKQALEWMGHEDEKMILRVYDHITEKRRKKSIDQVENLLSRVQNGVQD